ncbi:uncharacterized protein LOC125660356 [Ostrea edulis]|uniref:uncharacterized protein LOC125660356 n=1 Tax=Ostrea edulis TaxID=37623 RepID=UPI0024AF9D5E|nr:uncharacterized protein LOC125660356 [Ostrea edulis]
MSADFIPCQNEYNSSDTFFGVIDVGKNNLWTQLDGTVIDSSFTSTFDGSTGQPNGGSSQNCIVINAEPSSTHAPDKTQDKACSSSYKTKSMLCYIDTKEFCFGWTSTADNIVREHCYWLITKPKSSSQWNVVDALYRCTSEGGTLAPAIDTVQMSFIKESLTSIFESSTVTKTGVWMGSNTIRGKEWNLDNQPNFLSSTSTGSITPEKCMRLEKDSLNTGYINCRSDSTSVRGAVCARYGTGNIVIEHVPSSSAPTVTNTTTSTTTLKATTTTTTTTTPEPETTVTPASTNAPCVARSDVYNLTSVETIKMALTVDPKETTAYKSTLTCAEDDRVVSRYIGYTGVFTISTVMASFIFMDCIRICTGC